MKLNDFIERIKQILFFFHFFKMRDHIIVDEAKGNLANFPLTTLEASNLKFIETLLQENNNALTIRAAINLRFNRDVTFINNNLLGSNASLRQLHIDAATATRDRQLLEVSDSSFIAGRRALFGRKL
jgi:hypothetical protein